MDFKLHSSTGNQYVPTLMERENNITESCTYFHCNRSLDEIDWIFLLSQSEGHTKSTDQSHPSDGTKIYSSWIKTKILKYY